MKEFNLSLGVFKDIKIQIPDSVEITNKEAFMLAIYKLQDLIADGLIMITERYYPCLFCGRSYKDQARLIAHMDTPNHKTKVDNFRKVYNNFVQKPVAKVEDSL